MNQIDQYQQKLFNRLFTNLPSIRNSRDFDKDLALNIGIKSFYHFTGQNFWFARGSDDNKYFYLFGVKDKPIRNIKGDDACLIIDFDKNNQFNDDCLGLFSVKNSIIHVLINYNILKNRYPNINTSDFKISTLKSTDNSKDIKIIDLGGLYGDFIDNIGKLIENANLIKSQNNSDSQNIKKDDDVCEICSKQKNSFKLDSKFINLKNLKPELCGTCIEKIVASEFYTKLSPSLMGIETTEIKIAKEKFNNNQLFDLGINLLEKYDIIRYFGIENSNYIIDKNSFLVKKFIKYSDKNNLLIDNIFQNKDLKPNSSDNTEMQEIPRVFKLDSLGNKITISKMNQILEDLVNGESEEEAIINANISKNTYNYWLNRGKQEFGNLYIQFYNYVDQIKRDNYNNDEIFDETLEDRVIDPDIYAPLPAKYEDLFKSTHMNKSGIAWVNHIGNRWIYAKNLNGNHINFSDEDIYELHRVVKGANHVWGIRDYDRARKIIDIPDDFEVPVSDDVESSDLEDIEVDPDIYAPLPIEYESSFRQGSMNQTGIAWVNKVGKKWNYIKYVNGEQIYFLESDIYELHRVVKGANHVWGIRDYDRARKIIDIPDDFEVPVSDDVESSDLEDIEVDPDIYAPLPTKYENLFKSTHMNKSGIAWVNHIGNRWIYAKNLNGNHINFSEEDIYELHRVVKAENHVWGIRDYDRARKIINIPDDFEVPVSDYVEEIDVIQDIFTPLPKKYLSGFNLRQQNKTGIAWVNKIGKKWVYQRKINGRLIKFTNNDIHNLYEEVIQNNQIWGIIDHDKAIKIIGQDNTANGAKDNGSLIDSQPVKPKNTNNVIVTYIESPLNDLNVIIKGVIKNTELISCLTKLDLFEKNIKRIVTNSIDNQIDIFIELEFNKYLKRTFEEKISDLGWKVYK